MSKGPIRLDRKSKHRLETSDNGIGYYIPPNMTKKEFLALKKEWEDKLLSTGHDEIEKWANDGTTSYFFQKTIHGKSLSGSAKTVARLFAPDKAEYYRRLGLYAHGCRFHKHFKDNHVIYSHMSMMLADGKKLREIAAFFSQEDSPWEPKRKKTIFWAYYHKEILLKHMTWWFKLPYNQDLLE